MKRLWAFQRLPRAGLLVVLAVVAAALAACGGDEEDERGKLTEEEYVREWCLAGVEFRDAALEIVKTEPSPTPVNTIFLEPFEKFVARMGEVEAPETLAAWHEGWIRDLEQNIEQLKAGDPNAAPDPFDIGGPYMEPEVAQRLDELFARLPECQQLTGEPQPTPAAPTPTVQFPGPPTIDYSNPQAFLRSGPQSQFTDDNAALVREEVGTAASELDQAGLVAQWARSRFRGEPSGGATIGKTDVNGLMASRTVTGCHDQALLVAASLRLFGIPALMADSAGIQWAEDFRAGRAQVNVGHVFVEAFIDGDWAIIECGSGQYTFDYDTSNPVIPFPLGDEPKGFYVIFKGVDPASYGVNEHEALLQRMRQFAQALPELELVFPEYRWQTLPGQGR